MLKPIQPLTLTPQALKRLALPPPGRPVGDVPVVDPNDWPDQFVEGCSAERVQLAGGFLNTLMVHPEIVMFERLFRRQPEEGMFSPEVSPSRPFAFELGAFRAPSTFTLLLFNLRPDIYRFSGVDAGDTVPVEARRFSSILGFETTIDQRQPANISYQIDPVPIQAYQQAFTPPISTPGELPPALANELGLTNGSRFAIARSTSAAAASGAGDSLQPQRPTRFGPLSTPFTMYIRPGQTFQARCVIFRPVPSPIAFIEYDIAGMLIPDTWVRVMTECMKPLSHASGGFGSRGPGPR